MTRFLYQEIECCKECPFYRLEYECGHLEYCSYVKNNIKYEDYTFKGKIIEKQTQEWCPLPKEFGIEVKAIGVRSGDLAVLKIPERLNDKRDSIVQATAEALRQLDILPAGLLVVIDDGAGLEMVTEEEMNNLGWYRSNNGK